MKETLIVGIILALLFVGLFITLRSGNVNLATRAGRRDFLDNLSSMVFRLIAYVVGLAVVERFAGLPMDLPW